MIKQVDKDNGFISLAVKRINPNAEFVIRENNLDMITWGKDTTPISKSDIETKIIELNSEYTSQDYIRKRASQYPELKEQLDMQYKDLLNGTTTWKDAVAKVKSDNPKS